MGNFKDGNFPLADNPNDVGWFITYWRTTPCYSGCHPETDYKLESRQFQHLVKAATREEALAEFNHYVEQKKLSGEIPSIKGLTLFLSKIDTMVQISDNNGKMIT